MIQRSGSVERWLLRYLSEQYDLLAFLVSGNKIFSKDRLKIIMIKIFFESCPRILCKENNLSVVFINLCSIPVLRSMQDFFSVFTTQKS